MKFFCQVNLHQGSNQGFDVGINKWVGTPIYNNINSIYQFTLTILLIIAIMVTIKIYGKFQQEEDVIEPITKWFFGLVISFAIISFLKYYIQHQNFGVYTPPTI